MSKMRWMTNTTDNLLTTFGSFGIQTTVCDHGPLLLPHTCARTRPYTGCFSGLLTSFKITKAVVQCWGGCSGCGSLRCSRGWAHWVSSRLSLSGPSGPRVSVFDQPIDVMLGAVLAGGHLKDVGYAKEGFQCVSVGNHLRTEEREAHPVHN